MSEIRLEIHLQELTLMRLSIQGLILTCYPNSLLLIRAEIQTLLTFKFNDQILEHKRPRKWNVCVISSHDLYEHPHINDLAYMPATKNGRFGFNLLVGGFFSPKRIAETIPLDAWVPADDVIPLCKAVLEAYRDLGTRGNRQKTRMMWLIDELGVEGFRSEVVKRMPQQELERSFFEDLVRKDWERRDYLGVHPQKQEGFSYAGLHIPVGRVQADDMDELAQ